MSTYFEGRLSMIENGPSIDRTRAAVSFRYLLLPIDLSFLRRIDLCEIDAFVIEKDLHIIEKELVRIGVGYVQAEVVDELHLFLLPFCPAIFTHFVADLLAKLGRDRRVADGFTLFPAAGAFEFVTK